MKKIFLAVIALAHAGTMYAMDDLFQYATEPGDSFFDAFHGRRTNAEKCTLAGAGKEERLKEAAPSLVQQPDHHSLKPLNLTCIEELIVTVTQHHKALSQDSALAWPTPFEGTLVQEVQSVATKSGNAQRLATIAKEDLHSLVTVAACQCNKALEEAVSLNAARQALLNKVIEWKAIKDRSAKAQQEAYAEYKDALSAGDPDAKYKWIQYDGMDWNLKYSIKQLMETQVALGICELVKLKEARDFVEVTPAIMREHIGN